MKYFFIPTAALALLLGLSLWNAEAVETRIEPWRAALREAEAAAERGAWEDAERRVRETREAWQGRHPYFHIVTAHDELDQADALFAQSESFARDREAAELRAALAALDVQLRVVAEMQKLTVKNVL